MNKGKRKMNHETKRDIELMFYEYQNKRYNKSMSYKWSWPSYKISRRDYKVTCSPTTNNVWFRHGK